MYIKKNMSFSTSVDLDYFRFIRLIKWYKVQSTGLKIWIFPYLLLCYYLY